MKTSKELVIAAIKRQEVERVPWVPFIGVHSGTLIGKGADELLRDTDTLVAGQRKAIELYQPDGIPVTFDLQIEAEALGCSLKWEKTNPPAVSSHVLENNKGKFLDMPTLKTKRIPIVMEAAKHLRGEFTDIALYGLFTGPFTLAMHLLGANLFIQMYDDPQRLKKVLAFCSEVGRLMIDGYVRAGCDVIALVDPLTSQIGPEQFSEFVTPECVGLFKHIRSHKKLSSFFVCGHALKNLEVMCDCGPDNLSVDENIPLDIVKNVCLERDVSFGGNMRLTTVLLNGTPDSCSVHAYECIKTGGQKGYILSPGCDMPYQVPAENIKAVTEVVRDEYKRQIASELAEKGVSEDLEMLDLSEYGRADKIVIDIITLDSEACAPCQYMVESVKDIVPEFSDLLIWREHKIKSQESVAFMASLMVKNVPTICIDGEIKFVSRIPARDELIKAIQDRINEKLKLKIKRTQSKITVVIDDSRESIEAFDNVCDAVKELGLDIDIKKETDASIAAAYGAKKLPAIIFSVSNLKSWGKAEDVKVIKEWLKGLNG
jgi:MtaA/CmuA family methyltransferase